MPSHRCFAPYGAQGVLRGDEPMTENRKQIRDIAEAEFGAYKIRVIRL
ncbi:MAG: hypothetical protein IKJ56_08080 [Bacteroidales bacterium]|nr:hypothetical protein [Bacteroidales bacterium]